MGTADVEEVYYKLKGSYDGWEAFKKEAKKVGTKTRNGFIYTDESMLYEVFEKHLSLELKSHGIDCFGRQMQYIS